MKIGGLQKLTLLDFPNYMAAIVFTQGCNFRCPFCHNAGLVVPGRGEDPQSEASVLTYLEQRRNVLDGVVITGGEPLLQPDIKDFILKLRNLSYKIKLDSNGSFPVKLKELLDADLLDYVAMDIKQMPGKYHAATNTLDAIVVPKVEESLSLLRKSGVPFELRTTIVKGIHTPEDMRGLASWISKAVGKDCTYYLQPYVISDNIIAPAGLATFTNEELQEMLTEVQKLCPNTALRK